MTGSHDRVWMIGWEYPPHNSGGLGVACAGLTSSLAESNTQIYFTLPYTQPHIVPHMQVMSCLHPDWENAAQQPPFTAYSSLAMAKSLKVGPMMTAHQLAALPQSELEVKVSQYADIVTRQAQGQHKINLLWRTFTQLSTIGFQVAMAVTTSCIPSIKVCKQLTA
jgi:hypothetical protein